jgi:hypothetical protein
MLNKTTSRKFIAPRRQARKEIQKSPFHPPFTKGERGGFKEPWRVALRPFDLAQDMLCASHLFPDSAVQKATGISNTLG